MKPQSGAQTPGTALFGQAAFIAALL